MKLKQVINSYCFDGSTLTYLDTGRADSHRKKWKIVLKNKTQKYSDERTNPRETRVAKFENGRRTWENSESVRYGADAVIHCIIEDVIPFVGPFKRDASSVRHVFPFSVIGLW